MKLSFPFFLVMNKHKRSTRVTVILVTAKLRRCFAYQKEKRQLRKREKDVRKRGSEQMIWFVVASRANICQRAHNWHMLSFLFASLSCLQQRYVPLCKDLLGPRASYTHTVQGIEIKMQLCRKNTCLGKKMYRTVTVIQTMLLKRHRRNISVLSLWQKRFLTVTFACDPPPPSPFYSNCCRVTKVFTTAASAHLQTPQRRGEKKKKLPLINTSETLQLRGWKLQAAS